MKTEHGAKIYTPLVLKLYDWWVLDISNQFAWQCPTKQVLLPFFNQYLSDNHLDIGVGTGYYLQHANLAPNTKLMLMDLNLNSLQATRERLKDNANIHQIDILQHDVMQPLAIDFQRKFDSISLFYLLHCLPDTLSEKAVLFQHLKTILSDNGKIFGATILGDDVQHNWFGKKLMKVYNQKGIFGNRHDTLSALDECLKQHFAQVDITQHGKVALFVASLPK